MLTKSMSRQMLRYEKRQFFPFLFIAYINFIMIFNAPQNMAEEETSERKGMTLDTLGRLSQNQSLTASGRFADRGSPCFAFGPKIVKFTYSKSISQIDHCKNLLPLEILALPL